ncbi:MAG: hypothetical protein MI757_11165 [Pirellulales bacterium]|nr:hypothetical protein [Pirellulales bacterium]
MKSLMLTFAAALVAFSPVSECSADEKARQALEKRFAETLSGATLVGYHTDSNKPAGKLTEERYTISSVSKVKDDHWLFKARIKYGKHDMTVPMTLQVKWAGDTPVITLTDLSIPFFGKFSARVLIYDGAYAGTWSGATHGGQLFGKVVKDDEKKTPETSEAKSSAP